jgi:16S rRNA (guanine527-N7)-methyltransferase
MPILPLDVLESGASELGIELSERQLDLMDQFASLLIDANSRFNLTRITQPAEIVTGHYLDSLLYLWAIEIPQGAALIDVGTGAGFPGVPIKIARPDLALTLVDSTAKKVRFLEEAVSELGLQGVSAIHARAEDLGRDKGHRERYDIVVTRALAELRILAELCVPLARVGGRVVASKGEEIDAELAAGRPMIGQLGGVVENTVRTHIPRADIPRRFVVIAKAKTTPEQFPRSYARMKHARRTTARSDAGRCSER